MAHRRDFLKASALLSLAPTVPGFLERTARAARPDRDGRVLVVVQLDGGNDGINAVVPHRDPGYARHRRPLRLPADRLIRVNDQVGLHPALADAGRLLEAGQFAIVQGVSYRTPKRAHFRSMAIWHSAGLDPEEHGGLGWLGRALDRDTRAAVAALAVGSGPPPVAIRGRRGVASALDRLEDFLLAPGADPRRVIAGNGPDDDLTAFVRRSMLDAYATAHRLTEASRARGAAAPYPGTAPA